ANVPLAERPADMDDDDGDRFYDGPVDSDLVTERFSSATLAALADEVCLQQHLLARGFLLPVADRVGEEVTGIGIDQLSGIAGLASKRLARLLKVDTDLAGVAEVLTVHPMLLPRAYTGAEVTLTDDTVEISLSPSPALREEDGLTWPSLLTVDAEPIITAARAVLATAVVELEDGGDHTRW